MNAWIGFGIGVAILAACVLTACALVFTAAAIHRAARFLHRRARLWRMVPASRSYDREHDPAGAFWADIADGRLRESGPARTLQRLRTGHALRVLQGLSREMDESEQAS